MKIKYYLRGMGIGIIVTTLILMISFSQYKNDISDEEIIVRAKKLGMVMKEDKLFGNQNKDTSSETEIQTEVPKETETQVETEKQTEAQNETERVPESEVTINSENTEDTREIFRLEIFYGDMPRQICTLLEENGVIENGEALRLYLQEVGIAKYIPVGNYEIPYGATNEEVYQVIKAGPIR